MGYLQEYRTRSYPHINLSVMKKIIIAGGKGFLGKALEAHFTSQGNKVFILTRNPSAPNHLFWDGKVATKYLDLLEETDVLINLAGKSVDCRYTETNRQAILQSRIASTQALFDAVSMAKNPPGVWINASSATIYIHAETRQMTENEGIIGDDFSMNVCKAWEAVFFQGELPRTRRIAARTSIVLGNEGGAFVKLKQITRLGLGGSQGRGNQMVSWIHIADFCRAIEYLIEHESLSGPVNITAPSPVSNRELMREVRQKLNIPLGISQPVALLEIGAAMLGTETELLLKSRNVIPRRLLDSGFRFNWPEVSSALAELTGK